MSTSERSTVPAGASRVLLAGIFVAAGLLHFAITDSYVRVMPAYVPWPRALVLASGAAEIAGGAGLLVHRVRRAAGWGLVALLVAVWPANLQMYLDARAAGDSAGAQALLLLRLPLQLALMAWVGTAAGLLRR